MLLSAEQLSKSFGTRVPKLLLSCSAESSMVIPRFPVIRHQYTGIRGKREVPCEIYVNLFGRIS